MCSSDLDRSPETADDLEISFTGNGPNVQVNGKALEELSIAYLADLGSEAKLLRDFIAEGLVKIDPQFSAELAKVE